MPNPTHICNTDCYQKIGNRNHKRYYEGQFYTFDPKEEVPEYFDPIVRPKEEMAKSKEKPAPKPKSLEQLEKELDVLQKVKNPAPATEKKIETLEEKIAVMKGEATPEEEE
jgi:hypothetical protein